MGFRPLRAKVKILGNIRASKFRLSQFLGVLWSFSSVDLLCFLVVVLVVVESGDSLVARMVGEVFRCDLCDPCMMLSCAFIFVKKNNSGLYFILVSKDLRARHYNTIPNYLSIQDVLIA